MNTQNNNEDTRLSDALRWQLRSLRQDTVPANDLWPGIAARLTPQQVARPRPQRWVRPMALAASLVLAVGTVGWLAQRPAPQPQPSEAATLVQREADSLALQYQAALQEVQAPMPVSLQPTAEALDRDVAVIREALARDPESVRLLEQLRRTYAHRLALAQRVTYT